MKPSFFLLALALAAVSETAAAQEISIVGPLNDGKPSPPASKPQLPPLTTLKSRTTRMPVVEASELAGFPPVQGVVDAIVRLVKDPGLPDPPPPTIPAAAVPNNREENRLWRSPEIVFLSVTVYDHSRSFVEIRTSGQPATVVRAWSNVNFHHFSGCSSFRVTNQDGTYHDVCLIMGIGDADTKNRKAGKEAAENPSLPELASAGPVYLLAEGDEASKEAQTLFQLHELYRKEGNRLETAYEARVKAYEERKAYLLANPPQPKDVTISFWKREKPLSTSQEEGNAK